VAGGSSLSSGDLPHRKNRPSGLNHTPAGSTVSGALSGRSVNENDPPLASSTVALLSRAGLLAVAVGDADADAEGEPHAAATALAAAARRSRRRSIVVTRS